jgi:hypothetical protein
MTPENSEKMQSQKTQETARQGAQIYREGDWATGRALKRFSGLFFGSFQYSVDLSAVFTPNEKLHTKGAKTPFKRPLKGGLKKTIKNAVKSLTSFSHFSQNRRFCHVEMD